MKLKVSEIFYTLQGEGVRTGKPTTFIRLSGCSVKNACFASGIICDTEFESGKEMTINEIMKWMDENSKGCKDITWTGGEPCDQLTYDIIQEFKNKQYFQTIETSGLYLPPDNIDFISVSPKVAEHVLKKVFKDTLIDELRYVRHKGQDIPKPSVNAMYLFVSPHSDGFTINKENLNHCIDLCKQNPEWRVSVQDHKLWNIL